MKNRKRLRTRLQLAVRASPRLPEARRLHRGTRLADAEKRLHRKRILLSVHSVEKNHVNLEALPKTVTESSKMRGLCVRGGGPSVPIRALGRHLIPP